MAFNLVRKKNLFYEENNFIFFLEPLQDNQEKLMMNLSKILQSGVNGVPFKPESQLSKLNNLVNKITPKIKNYLTEISVRIYKKE
jgi:hypothetical protein